MATQHEGGQGIIEVLVALFILGLVSTAFLGLAGAHMRGALSARQKQAAVTCAQQVVEQIRAAGGSLPAGASCGSQAFPELVFEVTTDGSGGSMVTVSIYARTQRHDRLVYAVSTARSLGVSPP